MPTVKDKIAKIAVAFDTDFAAARGTNAMVYSFGRPEVGTNQTTVLSYFALIGPHAPLDIVGSADERTVVLISSPETPVDSKVDADSFHV